MACRVARSRLLLGAALLLALALAALAGITTFSGLGSVPISYLASANATAAGLSWVVPVYASLSGVVVVAFVLVLVLCACRQRGGAEVRTPLLTVTDE